MARTTLHSVVAKRSRSDIRRNLLQRALSSPDQFGCLDHFGKLRERTDAGQALRWRTLGEYFDLVERRGVSINVASYVGVGQVWRCVMGSSHARPTPAQFENMLGRRYQSATDSSWNTWGTSGVGNDRNTNISYYNNGAMLGIILDLAIRRQTGGDGL